MVPDVSRQKSVNRKTLVGLLLYPSLPSGWRGASAWGMCGDNKYGKARIDRVLQAQADTANYGGADSLLLGQSARPNIAYLPTERGCTNAYT